MKRFYQISFSLFLSIGISFGGSDHTTLESELNTVQTRIDSLTVFEKNVASSLDSLAEKITSLKSEKRLSYFERHRLENLLKESQALVHQQQELQSEIAFHKIQRNTLAEQLIHQYSIVIDSLLTQADQETVQIMAKDKTALLQEAQVLQIKRDVLIRKMVVTSNPNQREVIVELLPGDTPREIEEKADYLNDQEDKLRRRAEIISAKIKELEAEADLRLRMSELIDDIRLFDPREESLSPDDVANVVTKDGSHRDAYWTNLPLNLAEDRTAAMPPVSDQMLMIDISDITPEDMDELISNFELQSQQLLHKADSLSAVAKMFREQVKLQRENKILKR